MYTWVTSLNTVYVHMHTCMCVRTHVCVNICVFVSLCLGWRERGREKKVKRFELCILVNWQCCFINGFSPFQPYFQSHVYWDPVEMEHVFRWGCINICVIVLGMEACPLLSFVTQVSRKTMWFETGEMTGEDFTSY